MSYQSKDSQVLSRQLKVQRLVIPFLITGNATPASVVVTSDEPSILFFKTEGIDQITIAAGALDAGEATPSFDLTADDSDGQFNMLVKITEDIIKIQSASVVDRLTGAMDPCYKNTTGISVSANGDKILLNCNSAVNLASANLDGCLIVEYIVAE